MDIQVGDILTMKKQHPCGEKRWEVLRIGADFKLRCLGCGRDADLLGLVGDELLVKVRQRGE